MWDFRFSGQRVWRWELSGIQHSVVSLTSSDVSEVHTVSIFRAIHDPDDGDSMQLWNVVYCNDTTRRYIPKGSLGYFPEGKAAVAWSKPTTPSDAEVKNAKSYTPLHRSSAKRGTCLKKSLKIGHIIFLALHNSFKITSYETRPTCQSNWQKSLNIITSAPICCAVEVGIMPVLWTTHIRCLKLLTFGQCAFNRECY
jgi:hypothetical protein